MSEEPWTEAEARSTLSNRDILEARLDRIIQRVAILDGWDDCTYSFGGTVRVTGEVLGISGEVLEIGWLRYYRKKFDGVGTFKVPLSALWENGWETKYQRVAETVEEIGKIQQRRSLEAATQKGAAQKAASEALRNYIARNLKPPDYDT